MTTLRYEVVDVFTDRPFVGNPLAVVYGADELAGDQLQAIAREFNLSETIFVLPPTTAEATYRARIFTPAAEIPFAGHPSVGVAATLCRAGRFPAGTVVQECGAGLLPIIVEPTGSATLTGATPYLGPELDPAPLLRAAGLTDADFAGPAPRQPARDRPAARRGAGGRPRRRPPHPRAGAGHLIVDRLSRRRVARRSHRWRPA